MSERTFVSKLVRIWRLRQRLDELKKAGKNTAAIHAEIKTACSALWR